jgi:hypothetical protein
VVYSLAKQTSIVVSFADGSEKPLRVMLLMLRLHCQSLIRLAMWFSIKVALEPGLE